MATAAFDIAVQADTLSFRREPASGLVCVHGAGFWTAAQADRHFRDLDGLLKAIRCDGDAVRVLVDLRAAAVQAPETAACIRDWTNRLYEAEDRIAVVVATSLARMQMRRVLDSRLHEIFLLLDAGRRWLLDRG